MPERVHDHPDGENHQEGRHRHDRGQGRFLTFLRDLVLHSHESKDSFGPTLEASRGGTHTVAVCLIIRIVVAGLQALVVVAGGSVALLGDRLHNAADGFSALPLWLAFRLERRPPTSRFTFGYGKAEDVAGVVVVVGVVILIAASAALAGYEAINRLLHPQRITHLGFVMAAALVGAVGNGVVAQYRIRIGRRIGSAALEADGLHARADGMASLWVLVGAFAVMLGWRSADSVMGLLIVAAIAVVGYHAARNIGARLLDAIDPQIVHRITEAVATVDGVLGVSEVKARWVGHRLFAQVRLSVEGGSSVIKAHEIAEAARHALLHAVSNLADAIIHVDPATADVDPHASTAHHRSGHT